MLVLSLILGSVVPGLAPDAKEPTEQAIFRVDAIEQTTTIFKLPPGPRTIQRVAWRPDPSSDCWRSARVRIVWDHHDPERSAVDLPLGLFVTPRGSPEDRSNPSRPLFENRRHMPYHRGGRLILETTGPVRGTFELVSTPGHAPILKYLWARSSVERPWPAGFDEIDRPWISKVPNSTPVAVYRYWMRPGPVPKPTSEPFGRD